MWSFGEPEESGIGKDVVTFAIGAVGGLVLGLMLSQRGGPRSPSGPPAGVAGWTGGRRFRPGRLRRYEPERAELTALEDAIIDAYLEDEVLGERGIDVGAVSPGIVELSGSVRTDDEADRAVRIASGVEGVRTVVNRLDLEHDNHVRRRASRFGDDEFDTELAEWQGGSVGMGRRRQSPETDPDRRDDSRHMREVAYDRAAREDWLRDVDAAAAGAAPDEGGEFEEGWAQDLNPDARVGEGLEPGTELRLEEADVPEKPHEGA